MTQTTHSHSQAVEAAVQQEIIAKLEPLLDAKNQSWQQAQTILAEIFSALTLPQEVAAEVGNAEISLLELISELEDAAAEYAHEMSSRAERDKLVACRAKVSGAVRLLSALAASRSPAPAGVAGGVDAPTDEQIMRYVGGPLTSVSDNRPLGQQWDQVCHLVRIVLAATQAQPSPHPGGVLSALNDYSERWPEICNAAYERACQTDAKAARALRPAMRAILQAGADVAAPKQGAAK